MEVYKDPMLFDDLILIYGPRDSQGSRKALKIDQAYATMTRYYLGDAEDLVALYDYLAERCERHNQPVTISREVAIQTIKFLKEI